MFTLVSFYLVIFLPIKDVYSASRLIPYLQPDNTDSGLYDDRKNIPDNVCCRPCVKGESKTCYYRLVVEPYVTMGHACGNCSTTMSHCYRDGCVTADGCERAILTINRKMPGPSIQVCKGDRLIIDVKNAMPGRSLTIHWHGVKQKDSKYMDGVPMVTQCPINEAQIFRYHFYANDPGLHFYHSHDGLQKVDGVVGALMVRVPESEDPNSDLYDFDLPSHVIVIQDWYHLVADEMFPGTSNLEQMAESYVIQGKGIFYYPNRTKCAETPIATFNVTQGNRYVFRIIAGTCFECQYVFTIEDHDMLIIGADANPTKPYKVDSLTMSPGERFSVVVNCNRRVGGYWIQVRTLGYCKHRRAYQVAVLRYRGHDSAPSSPEPGYNVNSVNYPGRTMNPVNSNCTEEEEEENGPCIADLRSHKNAPANILADECDKQIVWAFGFYYFEDNVPTTKESKYPRFLRSPNLTVGSTVNGVVWEFPPSPLMSQWDDVPENIICPEQGFPYATWNKDYQQCVNVIPVTRNSVVEICMLDAENWEKDGMSHAIHLHGYDMYVLEQGVKPPCATLEECLDGFKKYLNSDERNKKPKNPVKKDTIALTAGGYCIVRIYTDNTGFWYFHCHFAYHLDSGMAGVLRVGHPSDIPPPPEHFPRCGDYLPAFD